MNEPSRLPPHESPELQRLPPERMGWTAMLFVLFGALALGGIFFASAYYTAPALISDWRVQASARPVVGARISDGNCTTKLIISICDVTLSLPTQNGVVTRRVNYVFAGLGGNRSVGVMADPARPELVTTDLGLDRLWNRTIVLVLLMGALAAGVYGSVVSLRGGRGAAGA